MAEPTPQSAPKPASETAEGVVTDHAQEVVKHAREVLKEEAKKSDITDGPADNLTGDASKSPEDHVFSADPYKKAFPPGPDDPTKA